MDFWPKIFSSDQSTTAHKDQKPSKLNAAVAVLVLGVVLELFFVFHKSLDNL